jgi:STAM-binding protein
LQKIRLHPNASDAPPENKAKVKKLLKIALPRAEELKRELTEIQQMKIDNYLKKVRAEEERIKREKEEQLKAEQSAKTEESSETVALFLSGIGGETVENTVQEQTTTSRPFVTPSSVPEVPNEEEGDDDTVEAWLTPGPPVGMDTSSTTPESSNQYDIGPPIVALNPENPYVPTNSNPLSYPVVSQEELAFTSLMSPPMVDRTTKPPSSLSTDIDWAGEGLRTVIVSTDVPREFLSRASSNTRRNVETCGILAGSLSQGCLKLTHIIIPKQTGTADSCDTCNEEEIFDVLDGRDLITLGWIHTHPSQTSFMSSVDMHTQCSYQLMMPEAISIVVAPKFDEVGHFTLTVPYGLEHISKCRKSGFHPHPKEPPLYEESSHVRKDPSFGVVIIDLR